jgi:hypothetical protein
MKVRIPAVISHPANGVLMAIRVHRLTQIGQ